MWHETGHRAEVTCIVQAPQKHTFAVGYADGSVRLWNASTISVLTTFNGHRKAVTALAFDERGTRLASGSQDTDLIVWDVVAEAGICRQRVKHIPLTSILTLSPGSVVIVTKSLQFDSWMASMTCPPPLKVPSWDFYLQRQKIHS